MIGGHGTGKTMMIRLEASRAARFHADEDTEAKIFFVVWETQAVELLEEYKRFKESIKGSDKVELEVFNKEEICTLTQVNYKGRDTTSIINDITKNLSETNKNKKVYLFLDEVEVESSRAKNPKDLVGKLPFCVGGEVFPWFLLDPHEVQMVVAVTADSKDLAMLVNIEEAQMEELKTALLSVPAGTIPTAVLWRVFRCTNSIQNFVEYLQLECYQRDMEIGFSVHPQAQKRGHDIRGDLVEWISCPEKKHMICANNCDECFLITIEEALEKKISALESEHGIPPSDVTVIVSMSKMTKSTPENFIKEFFERMHRDVQVKLNFEMEGLEAPVVILIRDGGPLGATISHGISRATTKLVLVSTDDKGIMDRAVKKRLVRRVDMVRASELLKTPVQEEEGSSAIIEKEGVPRPKPDGDVDSAAAQAVPKGAVRMENHEEEGLVSRLSAVSIDEAMGEKLAKVNVSKGKLKAAKNILSKLTTDDFEEKLDRDATRDVKPECLDEFAESLVKTLELPTGTKEQVREKLKQLKFTGSVGGKDTRMLEVSYRDNPWSSIYGVLVVEKERGNYNVAYALHKVKFNITGTGQGRHILGSGSNEINISPEDIEAIKTDYCRHKALITMKEEGIIAHINYTE